MNNKAKLYLEYIKRKDEVPISELTSLDENANAWFDVLVSHPKFKDLFESLILTNNYYQNLGEHYDLIREILI